MLTLEQLKRHLRIEDDFTKGDQYLNDLLAVSEDMVKKHTGTDTDSELKEQAQRLICSYLFMKSGSGDAEGQLGSANILWRSGAMSLLSLERVQDVGVVE